MSKRTIYEELELIDNINDEKERIDTFRHLLMNNRAIAIIVQRVYHPDYHWSFDITDINEKDLKISKFDGAGTLYQSIKRWYVLQEGKKESLLEFYRLYESVAYNDSKILIAVLKKELPFKNLNLDFVVKAIPELFPSRFLVDLKNKENKEEIQEVFEEEVKKEPIILKESNQEKSKKQVCREIYKENIGLSRKNMSELFAEKTGVTIKTAVNYYEIIRKE